MSLIGKVINNCYKIVKKIGSNEICNVYKLEGLYSPLDLVIKIFKRPNKEYLLEELIRFKQESMYIYNLSHKNIVKVLEVDEIDGFSYVIMEYVDCFTLKEFLEKETNLSFEDIFKIILSITKGLEAAHQCGAIHKNLNIQNILIPKNKNYSQVKITNFGFSELIFGYDNHDKNFYENILNFFPPESCIFFGRQLDERSDLFSLGMIFYYLLTRIYPFRSESIREYYQKLLCNEILPPSKISNYIYPEIIDKIIIKLLSIEKKNRYQNAKSLLADLEKVERGETNFTPGSEELTFDTNFETDLINRENELKLIKTLINEKKIFSITGVTGIGKSRLLKEVAKESLKENFILIFIPLIKSFTEISFYTFFEFLKKYSFIISFHFPELEKDLLNLIEKKGLFSLFPIFNIKKPKKEKLYTPELISKDEVIKKYLDLFLNIVNIVPENKKIIISIKNVNFIDEESTLLFKYIFESIKEKNISILFSYDQTEQSKNPIFLKIIKAFPEITLEKLSDDQNILLIKNIIPGCSDKDIKILYNYITKNNLVNPYFIIETIRQLVNIGVIYPVINSWEINFEKLKNIKLSNENEILKSKLNYLKENEKSLLYTIVLYCYPFDIETLFKISELDKNEIISIIDYFVQQEILEIDFFRKNHKYYIKKSIANIINELIDKTVKKIIHEKIALMLEKDLLPENPCDKYQLIAYHYEKAERWQKAIQYYYKASLSFLDIYGYNSALLNLKNTKKLLEKYDGQLEISLNEIEELIEQIEVL